MTSQPADVFRLAGRGRLEPGAYADIAVLDPATVADKATFDNPHQPAVGMHHVIVNGQIAVEHGKTTQHRPGRRLRRGIA